MSHTTSPQSIKKTVKKNKQILTGFNCQTYVRHAWNFKRETLEYISENR